MKTSVQDELNKKNEGEWKRSRYEMYLVEIIGVLSGAQYQGILLLITVTVSNNITVPTPGKSSCSRRC
jgi:hypothetical protein